MNTIHKIILALCSPFLIALSSCDRDDHIDKKQMLGTFQLAYYPETIGESTEYKQQAFTLMPDGKLVFHDINFKTVFGKYIYDFAEKNKLEDLKRLPVEACSLNGVEGKWEFFAESRELVLYIDASFVQDEVFKAFLQSYLRDGYYIVPFGNFATYSNSYFVTKDKSTIVILTYHPDPDNIISQCFIKKS